MNKMAQEKTMNNASYTTEKEEEPEQQAEKKPTKGKKGDKKKKKDKKKEAEKDPRKKKLNEVYDCLMFSQCQIQYAKYGNYIPLEQIGANIDIRILQQFLFYIVFTILTGVLSNDLQVSGLSFSRAIAIVFLLNEIEQLIYYQTKYEGLTGSGTDGVTDASLNSNPRIDFINSLFSVTFTVFEKISIQRTFYFFVFNVSCILSLIFSPCDKRVKSMDDLK